MRDDPLPQPGSPTVWPSRMLARCQLVALASPYYCVPSAECYVYFFCASCSKRAASLSTFHLTVVRFSCNRTGDCAVQHCSLHTKCPVPMSFVLFLRHCAVTFASFICFVGFVGFVDFLILLVLYPFLVYIRQLTLFCLHIPLMWRCSRWLLLPAIDTPSAPSHYGNAWYVPSLLSSVGLFCVVEIVLLFPSFLSFCALATSVPLRCARQSLYLPCRGRRGPRNFQLTVSRPYLSRELNCSFLAVSNIAVALSLFCAAIPQGKSYLAVIALSFVSCHA